jgi:hypothetical protein
MLQTLIIAVTLIITGWFIWRYRQNWRWQWQKAIGRSIIFQIAGFVLCVPLQTDYLGRVLFWLTHTAHLHDYFGHLCFICAAASVIYGIMRRVLPADRVEARMRRVERPSAAAAFVMLVAIFSSNNLSTQRYHDFFNVPLDPWLTLYWGTYWAILVYLIGYGMRLCIVLCQDPQSRLSADIFLIAGAIGLISITLTVVDLLTAIEVPRYMLWIALSAASVLVGLRAAWSRIRKFADR